MTIINNPGPNFSDYKDLVSEEDWNKYFKDKQYLYGDPLKLAMVRSNERLIEALRLTENTVRSLYELQEKK